MLFQCVHNGWLALPQDQACDA
ncbi:putative lipoprotein (fragment) [Cupriavidus taiwanensis]